MKRTLEQKFEVLIQQIKTQQYDGRFSEKRAKAPLTTERIIKLLEELRNADKDLRRESEELFFAYQTLETGYQRYWEFFNFAPDGYLVTDTSGIILEANQTILAMLSATPHDLIGKPITELIPEIKNQDFGMQLNWFIGSQQLEVHFQPPQHAPFYASLSVAPQYSTQNRAIGLLWLVRDITERKKMEEELRSSRAKLSLLLEEAPILLWATDKELKLTSVSGDKFSETSGISTRLNNTCITDFFGDNQDNDILKAHQAALSDVSQTFDFEWRGRTYEATIEALKNSEEKIEGVIGAAFDITERIKGEKVLQNSEKFKTSLLLHSPVPIAVISGDTTITYVNPAFQKLTGFSAKKIIGMKAPYPWWIDNSKDTSLKDFRKALVKKSKQEKFFRKKNGDRFWVESTIIPIENSGKPDLYLQTWVDITEAKRLRDNLEFYMMQITRAQEEERKRIAQELHEETVQSLAALCLATESIIKSKKNDPEQSLQALNDLKRKINGVIEEVRKFSYDLRPGVLDYLGLTAALETLADELNSKNIQTNLVISGQEKSLPPEMEIAFFRIAQEALNNVKRHSHANKVRISVNYTQSNIKLAIQDNGEGFILPPRLGDLANEGKLGIIGMDERTRLYRGAFTIQTRPGKGTKISITLPLSAN